MVHVLFFSLSLPIIQVNCKPPTVSDIPLDEKIRRIENGLFPGNGFPPWIKKSISQRMEYYNIPGVSIAVIDDYKLEWAKGYGVTEAGGNKPVTVETLFPAVGVSSTVSRFLALNLVERGLISLDEDINDKLVSWKIPGNEFTAKKKVTLRSLLRYNAAGFNEFEIKGYFKGEPLPSLLQILEGKEPANSPPIRVIAEPGVFRRAPSGNLFLVSYIVLQQLVNDVSKKPFHDAAREIILEPLGMKNSSFEQPLPRDCWHMAAAGHDADGRPVKGKWRIYPETAARGLWTTPADMARLAIELMKAYKGQSKRFVSRDTVFNMLTPKRSYYDFNSSNGEFRCSLVFNYNTGQGIIIMMNSGSGYSLKREIQHIVFSENRWKWGYFIMHKTIFTGMLLVIAAAAMLVTIPLLGILLFLQRRKKEKKIKNKKEERMKRIILIVSLVLVVFSFLYADVYVKNVKQTEAFEIMGKKVPGNVEIEEQWLGKNKFAIFTEKFNIIADFEKETISFIVPKLKKYFQFSTTIDKAKLQELLPPKAYEIISSIQLTGVKVNLNMQKKKIANWNCIGTEFEWVFMIPAVNIIPKMKLKLWTTKDVPFDYKNYTVGMSEFFARVFLKIIDIDENSKKELEKLDTVDGFQVGGEVIVSIFGSEIKQVSQCLEVTEKPAPAGIYSVPASYTKGTIPLPQK